MNKGSNFCFGMEAHIGVDVDFSLTHTVPTTPANELDVAQVAELLRAREKATHGDSGFTSAYGYVENPKLTRVVATRYSQVEKIANALERVRALRHEKRKAQVRAFVEHPFRIVRCVFGPRAGAYAVRAGESVHGAKAVDAERSEVASAVRVEWETPAQIAEIWPNTPRIDADKSQWRRDQRTRSDLFRGS